MFVNFLLRTGELIVLNFYPPHLCLAVCNYLIIFVPGIMLQLGETVGIGAKERKRKKSDEKIVGMILELLNT